MKKKKILELPIEELKLSDDVFKILKEKCLNIVEDIWNLKRKELRAFGLSDSEISQIAIKLQLYGIDLGKKIY